MTDNYERCSCGVRYKSKCVEESVSGQGKMCVRVIFEEKPEVNRIVDLCSGEVWYKGLKAYLNNRELDIATLDANTAYEVIENPPEPNEKLIELLRLE